MQATGARRPSITSHSQSPSRTSSLPRPTVTINHDNFAANSKLDSAKSPQASTPEAYEFYRRRLPSINGGPIQLPAVATGSFDRPSLRSASGPPLNSPKSNPALPTIHRMQKTSFKDLVARFNQPSNGDVATPSTHMEAARSVSATRGGHGAKPRPSKSRIHSETRTATAGRQEPTVIRQNGAQAITTPTNSEKSQISQRGDGNLGERPPKAEERPEPQNKISRQPLFGEVVNQQSQDSNLGYGIPRQRQRRGSEGSMHFPNPMFHHKRSRSDLHGSSTSPGAKKPPNFPLLSFSTSFPPQPSLSDFSNMQPIPFGAAKSLLQIFGPRESTKVLNSATPQSKIPVKTPSNISPASSDHGPSNTRVQRPVTPPTLLSSRRYDISPQNLPGSSQRLRAMISAPIPKKSPPLRSSRPRQNVSAVSSVSPNSKTFGEDTESSSPAGRPVPNRPSESLSVVKGIPDFDKLDLAGRRASIRKALSHTQLQILRVNEPVPDAAVHLTDLVAPAMIHVDDSNNGQTYYHSTVMSDDMLPQLSSAVYSRSAPKLTLDMQDVPPTSAEAPLTGATEATMSTEFEEDTSPALSMPGNYPHLIITGRSNSYGAEEERSLQASQQPQDMGPSVDQPNFKEHTVFSQVMHLRQGDSTNGVSSEIFDGNSLAASDAESIQIMLNNNPKTDGEVKTWRNRDDVTSVPAEHVPFTISDIANGKSASTGPAKSIWRPDSIDSYYAGRLTLDSDAYSVINRVLDQYQGGGIVTPAMVQDFQQHILEHDPELANSPDIDSMSIARVALEELIQDHSQSGYSFANGNILPGPYPGSSISTTPDEKYSGLEETEPHAIRFFHETTNEQAIFENSEPPRASGPHTMSPANFPERDRTDAVFAVSGSQVHSATGTFHQQDGNDAGPTPPPKDQIYPSPPTAEHGTPSDAIEVSHSDYGADPQAFPREKPQLPEIVTTGGGLGLAIAGDASQDSPTLPSSPAYAKASLVDPAFKTPTPRVKRKQPPVPYTTPPSDNSRSVSGQQNATPYRLQDDTLVTSSSKTMSWRSQDHTARNTSIEQDRQPTALGALPSRDQRRLIQRRHLIKELVDTEFSYNQDMKVIEDIYQGTASACKALTPDDRRILFGNSDQIVEFSEQFLDALKQAAASIYTMPRTNKWRFKRASFATSTSSHTDKSSMIGTELTDDEHDRKTFIGEAFGQHMGRMEKVYGDYLKNHDSANQRLQKLQPLQPVSVWLHECHTYASDITSAWDLDSLLVKPVQRILKYPLLLKSLLEVTPSDHPDHTALEMAVKEVMDMSHRINESKKRAELLDQVVNNRYKRREFDASLGLSKAFGRRTEKLRQQVGLSDAVEDPEYKAIAEKFGGHFFQLQVVMRDMDMYRRSVEEFMKQYNAYVEGLEELMDNGLSTSPEIESKWRKFAMTIREMTAIAFADHEIAVRRSCVEPLTRLIALHEGPQRLMQKRKKRLVDYAKYKTIKDRGEKPDKKVQEQGEQFLALNDTLKDELPKLFALTAKLVEACQKNLVVVQTNWHHIWLTKMNTILDGPQIPKKWSDIVHSFQSDFSFPEAQALGLGICNGSILADASNFLSPSVTLNNTESSASKRPSTVASSNRTLSSDRGQAIPTPDFNNRHSGSFTPTSFTYGRMSNENQRPVTSHTGQRLRSSSGISNRPGIFTPTASHQNARTSSTHGPYIPTRISNPTASHRPSDPPTSFPRFSVDSRRPTSGSTYYSATAGLAQTASSSPAMRYSGVFSSAMPMADSPNGTRPTSPAQTVGGAQELRVLFLAASLFEFSIDRTRKEAGYPYLTYVSGEVFDVVAQKGELWLARNQDDLSHTIGWIWEKHFAKLMPDD